VSSRTTVFCLVFLAFCSIGSADAPKNGAEFQVNSFTSSDQLEPAIAIAPNGDFVVAWQSWASEGSDDSYDSILAGRFAADGTPVVPQFQVNSFTFYRQTEPAVVMGPAGDFVVVWNSDPASTDSYWSIEGQRFSPAGAPMGGQFRINTLNENRQDKTSVGSAPDGRFVVVWESRGSNGSDTELMSVQGQRFDATSTADGSQFQVNTYTVGQQILPAVSVGPVGAFVVAWQSTGSDGTDTSGTSILAQRFSAAGSPLGGEFQVNSYTTGEQALPAVATAANGRFLVTWQSDGSDGDDSSGSSIQGQRYHPTGAPLGDQFQVNSYTTSSQSRPSVAADPSGQFVVTWQSNSSPDDDSSSWSIQGQRYDLDGALIGSQFQVNTFTPSSQEATSVVADPRGGFTVVWDSSGSSGSDSSGQSIQAQRYLQTLIFEDGFESGDTSAWSSTSP